MKKILLLIVALTLVAINAPAITPKEKKEIAKTAKQMTKEGWKSQNGAKIEDLLTYAREQEENGCLVLMGTAYGLPKIRMAEQRARMYATSELAELWDKQMGTHESEESSSETLTSELSTSSSKISITSESESVRVLFELVRQDKSGKFDCIVYLLYNPNEDK